MDLRVLFAVAATATLGITGGAFVLSALTLHAYGSAAGILAVLFAITYGLVSDASDPSR